MTISGSEVKRSIKDKIHELESQHDALSEQVYTHEKQLTALVDERETSYGRLAEIYLPELDAQSVKQTLREVQGDVQGIFQRKQDRRKELDELLQSSRGKKAEYEKRLEDVTEQLNEKASERDGLSKKIVEEIGANPDYVALHTQTQQSAGKLEQNKRRVEEAEAESAEKLPAYKGNKLFMYLLQRNFGRSSYQGGGIIRSLDGWVARIVGYADAKKNYDFLGSIPELMRIEVEHAQGELDSLVSQVQAIEREASNRHGLTKVLAEGTQLGKQRAKIIADIQELDSEQQSYSQERKDMDGSKDPYHQQAVAKLKDYLKGDDIAKLKALARGTPDSEDDKLVDRIEAIDGNVRDYKDKAKEAKNQMDSIEAKVEGLKDILNNFTSSDYDSRRSYFDEFDIDKLLIGYMMGKHSADSVWGHIESNQHFHQRESYSYGGHSGDSSSSGSIFSSGSGLGGGIFSGGGGFGGGGFSSGHGF